ncbi:hypothetical protein KP509_22G007200 [Ceratopteris richardii]|uniref:Amino acid transporter transmembrane domain-containing protein n=2 Tax=Ceratopteris richardii TaxID=49495 RepID=A0A8T2S4H3_CERRI|nr:hypothetical protein KP509_22G007200 [Ceratopteris richardii]
MAAFAKVKVDDSRPLLLPERSKLGGASVTRTFGNVIVSIIGTGVLGLPYTFHVSGWVSGILAILSSAVLSYYCMLLLVSSRNLLEERGCNNILTYGDLGSHAYGHIGQTLVDVMVLISQIGCCVAYLIFIGQNLSSIFMNNTGMQSLFICIILPMQILLAFVRSLSGLAPFSILADICNVLAMGVVIKDDLGSLQGVDGAVAFKNWSGIPFALGIAVFSYEGFGMTLALEASMKKPHLFPRVLAQAFVLITLLYIAFGLIGYLAFGDGTKDIITLNLPNDWSTIVVKAGLCIALAFTFPVMMYPVHEMVESKLVACSFYQRKIATQPVYDRLLLNGIRVIILLITGAIAIMVPVFGVFVSFVGSTVCAMLAFVFPAFFHLQVFKNRISTWQWIVDLVLIVAGIAFAVYGTYSTCSSGVEQV